MRKIVLSTVISLGLAVNAFATENNKQELQLQSKLFEIDKIQDDKMKGLLIGIEHFSTIAAEVSKDYYEAKTCTKEFYNHITIDDIKDFIEIQSTYAFLIALKVLEKDKPVDAKDNLYINIINNYKFMNCGIGRYKKMEMDEIKESARKSITHE